MKKELVRIILDFAEGRMSVEEFWKLYQGNDELRKAMLEELDRNRLPDAYFNPIEFLKMGVDLKSYGKTLNLFGVAKRILKYNNISYTPTEFYSQRYDFLLDIQPEWLDIDTDNEPFLISIVESAPENLSKAQKLKWCKDQIKTLFKYDNKPPRWVQHAEWPIKDGKPLVFRGQSKERTESELVKFFFYDPETNEETIVEQYY